MGKYDNTSVVSCYLLNGVALDDNPYGDISMIRSSLDERAPLKQQSNLPHLTLNSQHPSHIVDSTIKDLQLSRMIFGLIHNKQGQSDFDASEAGDADDSEY